MSTPNPYGLGGKRMSGPHVGQDLSVAPVDDTSDEQPAPETHDSPVHEDLTVVAPDSVAVTGAVLTPEQLREQLLDEQRAAAELHTMQKHRSHAPTGAIIPWFWSLPGIKYHIWNRALNRLDQVPEVGRWQRPHARLQRTEDEIRFYAANLRVRIAFINPVGGSGKSFTSSLIGQYIAWITSAFPLLMPMTRSTDTAATGSYTQLPPDQPVMTISRFYRLAGMLPDTELARHIPKTSLGLGVITHDPEGSIGDAASTISAETFIERNETAARLCDVLLADHGNDTVSRTALVTNSARLADVHVYVGTPGKQLSLDKIHSNIAKHMTDPTDNKLVAPRSSSRRRSGRQIPTEEKARKSIILITGVEPGEGPKDYATYSQRPLDDERRNTTSIGWEGVLLTIPKLKAMRNSRSLGVDPRKLTLAERQSLADFVVAMYRLAAQMQGFPYVYDPSNPAPLSRLLEMDDEALVAYTGHESHNRGSVSSITSHRPAQPATG